MGQGQSVEGREQYCEVIFLSPSVLLHVGLLRITFCPSVCLSICAKILKNVIFPFTRKKVTRKKVNRKKFISPEQFTVCSPNFVWWWTKRISRSCVFYFILYIDRECQLIFIFDRIFFPDHLFPWFLVLVSGFGFIFILAPTVAEIFGSECRVCYKSWAK